MLLLLLRSIREEFLEKGWFALPVEFGNVIFKYFLITKKLIFNELAILS